MPHLKKVLEMKRKLGLKPVAEADVGVSKYSSPLWVIEKFVTRMDENGKVWNANEKITREEALYMYTSWAARYTGDEDRLGSIEPGKLADLVVLDGDYMKVPEEEISKLKVLMTVVGGKVVYAEPKFTESEGLQ